METLLGWLPIATLILAGVGLGLVARRRALWWRVLVFLAPPATLGLAFAFGSAAPPCADFLDGPCEWNWQSDVAMLALFVVFPLVLIAAVALLLATAAGRASAAWRRRQRRGAGGRGRRSPP